jgi:peroxiredoxin
MKATAAVRLVTLSLLLMPVVLEGQPAGSLRSVNVQILGISANHFFSQKTFVEPLKLPYPLLSDFPDLRVIRRYGVLSASQTYAKHAFFLVDQQGIIRQRWLTDGGEDVIFPSEPILKAVQEMAQKR